MSDTLSLYFVQQKHAKRDPKDADEPPPQWHLAAPPRNAYPLTNEPAALALIEEMKGAQQRLIELKGLLQIGRVTHYRVVKVELPFVPAEEVEV